MSKGPTPTSSEESSFPLLAALVPSGLVPERQGVPFAELRREFNLVIEQALNWERKGIDATWWELQANVRGVSEARGHALAGQVAAVGEQLALAFGALVELHNWKRVQKDPKAIEALTGDRDAVAGNALAEMCSRAFAEMQAGLLLAAGHGLANVCAYGLCYSDGVRSALAARRRREDSATAFEPFSGDKQDWLELTGDSIKDLRRAARDASVISSSLSSGGKEAVLAFLEPARILATSPDWKTVSAVRGEFFHRWRVQSPGLPVVPRETPWEHHSTGTRKLSFGASPAPSGGRQAREFADRVELSSSQLMLSLAETMKETLEAWPTALDALAPT